MFSLILSGVSKRLGWVFAILAMLWIMYAWAIGVL
jgi:hypothetical protein